jgi:hypothetical protein
MVWLKKILTDAFIWFYMYRITFVPHFNPYFVTISHCPGGVGPFINEDF